MFVHDLAPPGRSLALASTLPTRGRDNKPTLRHPAQAMPGRTFDLFPHSLEQERGSGAPDGAPSMGSLAKVSLRPLRLGRLANRRSTAVFCLYRAVLPNRTKVLSHP